MTKKKSNTSVSKLPTSLLQKQTANYSLCKAFQLYPKYCHLQTNASSWFHYQIKECKGICYNKETVINSNKQLNKPIKSVGIGAANWVIKETERTKHIQPLASPKL